MNTKRTSRVGGWSFEIGESFSREEIDLNIQGRTYANIQQLSIEALEGLIDLLVRYRQDLTYGQIAPPLRPALPQYGPRPEPLTPAIDPALPEAIDLAVRAVRVERGLAEYGLRWTVKQDATGTPMAELSHEGFKASVRMVSDDVYVWGTGTAGSGVAVGFKLAFLQASEATIAEFEGRATDAARRLENG